MCVRGGRIFARLVGEKIYGRHVRVCVWRIADSGGRGRREGGRRMVCLSDHCGFLGLYVTWGEASVKGLLVMDTAAKSTGPSQYVV